jgi:hypothetical protein
MAKTTPQTLGFRQTYKETGHTGYAGGPGCAVEKGPSGSKMAPKAPLSQVPPVNSRGLKK